MAGVRWFSRAAGACVGLCALSSLAVLAPARAQAPLLTNGDFEAGASGWVAYNATLLVDDAVAGVVGPNAARVVAEGGGDAILRSQYWLTPAQPGADYSAGAYVHDEDPAVDVRMALVFLDAGQSVLPVATLSDPVPEGGFQYVAAGPLTAPAEAAYVQVSIVGRAAAAGATFAVDGVSLVEVAPPPTPSPTVAATPEVTPPPAVAPPAIVVAPTATPIPGILRNVAFENGTGSWDIARASVSLERVLGPEFGLSMVLRAPGTSSVWVQQLVTVTPGEWYEASAVLAPLQDVGAGLVRIAWYATPTGAGSQMSTTDSEPVSSPPPNALAETHVTVSTGPVQAPENALSARVRILLQPSAPGARLAVDDVRFEPSAPPAATPTPTPPASPTPEAPAPTPAPTATAPAPSQTSGPPVVALAPTAARPEADEAQRWLRISEVMPDPSPAGRDADFEWLEVTNLGIERASLRGMALRDGQAATLLPDAWVEPGASMVVGAPRAEVAAEVRLEGSIGNGLGNEGDRLLLVAPDGEVVDALAYGTEGPLPAPGAGTSLHRWFDAAGRPLGAAVGPPSPGEYGQALPQAEPSDQPSATPPAAEVAAPLAAPAAAASAGADGGPAATWMFLLAIAGGALGGAAVQRLGALARGRGQVEA